MGKFIIFLYRIINYYLYFVVMACFLSLIPNINPNYPLFHSIFKLAGFYLIPPVFGFIISPMIIMIVSALLMMGLSKIYDKYYAQNEPKVIVMSPEDFMKQVIRSQQEIDEQKNLSQESENNNSEITSESEDKKE